ncbi:hypothetical protein AOCH_004859 [Aspergillus ochraceoroseus]|uniref:chitinase n=1 Tax=Aspergillus ochraceoroseus TaxID=138278 RepID=A0A0F8UEV6_9EURO|nr:hypothetical protein AOCH_004859 [Aspergillus ochraceoroseus]
MWPFEGASLATISAVPMAINVILSGLNSGPDLCLASCTWELANCTVFPIIESLSTCNKPVVLDPSTETSINAFETPGKTLTCVVADRDIISGHPSLGLNWELLPNSSNIWLELTVDDSNPSFDPDTLHFILDRIPNYLPMDLYSDPYSLYLCFNCTVVGIYCGTSTTDDFVAAPPTARHFQDQIRDVQALHSATKHICNEREESSFGTTVDTTGSVTEVWRQVRPGHTVKCLQHSKYSTRVGESAVTRPIMADSMDTRHMYNKRHRCMAETVVFGDSCASLAYKCGISQDEFIDYNPEGGLCSSLRPGQLVCCTPRTPSRKPIMDENGSCASLTTNDNDTCSSIAAEYDLKPSDISYFNDGATWGWTGCDNIHGELRICLSEGIPPMPVPVSDAVCGPTVPGTKAPEYGIELSNLNPCPLNACCDTRGQCGITPEYCTPENGPTGNPGTAPPARRGCISNCGTNITNNLEGPSELIRIGYYESWNWDRPCLNLRARSINTSEYTHIHWGFATIDNKFNVAVNDTYGQWEGFLALKNVKRILSFGGWGYSLNSGSYDGLRDAMNPKNVDTFIGNILEFVEDNGLDGVDFDWEYPGLSSIPTVHLGSESDGPNYLAFLEKLWGVFPRKKSVSIAAPACFWNLKVFPIKAMSRHLSYIVYMTYDLHGQWDYNYYLAQDYCKTGNCLRSHVTKAGVPSNMITVGISSYGRSFGMSEVGCVKPECRFEGPKSTAKPGICTRTPGVLANAEIEDLINDSEINESFYDPGSDSNILVYNDTQWVSYMDKVTKANRIAYYKSLNFAGYADWAIDLGYWSGDDGDPEGIRY